MIRVISPIENGQITGNSSSSASRIKNRPHEKIKIAYLSNGKPNVHEIFSFIDQHLMELYPEEISQDPFEIRFFDKKNAAKPAPSEMLEEIKDYADILITGSAD
ncbi:hypothetical protein BABA_13757 [Neobacillus bataviensis LMG 21833]|uniref:UGSC-like domain-containing protein n=3 Tax=Neobacillus bataviensis TaxID=220685 RepID=K6DFU9_9BACI|nr:hypothetical protein BABA_13757 [Neobacillus bataviensis LMG 21833]